MGTPAIPPDEDAQLDAVFRALADRTRRQLLAQLAGGPRNVTDLASPFPMSLPAVSKHIKVLERAGLIRRTVDGRVHRCALEATPLRSARDFVDTYRVFWERTLDALADHVESGEQDDS